METTRRSSNQATGATRSAQRRRDVEYGGLIWLDLAQPSAADLAVLRERFAYDPLILDSILAPIRRPRLERMAEYLYVEVHLPTLDRDNLVVASPVGIFAGPKAVVVVHDGSLKPLRRMFGAAMQDEAARGQLMGRGPGMLAFRIIDTLIRQSFALLDRNDEGLQAIEARIFQRSRNDAIPAIAAVRRDVGAARAIVRPNLAVLAGLRAVDAPFLQLDTARYFGDCAQNLVKLWDGIEEQSNRIQALNATVDSLAAQRSAATLSLTAMLLLVLLPLVLLAALAALNAAVPVREQPLIFIAIVLIVAALAVGAVALARDRKML